MTAGRNSYIPFYHTMELVRNLAVRHMLGRGGGGGSLGYPPWSKLYPLPLKILARKYIRFELWITEFKSQCNLKLITMNYVKWLDRVCLNPKNSSVLINDGNKIVSGKIKIREKSSESISLAFADDFLEIMQTLVLSKPNIKT